MYEKNNNNLVWSIFKNELDQMLFFSQFTLVDFHSKFHQNTSLQPKFDLKNHIMLFTQY